MNDTINFVLKELYSYIETKITPDIRDCPQFKINYGTAGFRYDATLIKSIAERVGTMVTILSCYYGWETIGVMITASHNKPSDNGIKIVGPNGEMLDERFERILNIFVNCPKDTFDKFVEYNKFFLEDEENEPSIIIGMDTRDSGKDIKDLIVTGCNVSNTYILDAGIVTTPELHIKTIIPDIDYSNYYTNKFMEFVETLMKKS